MINFRVERIRRMFCEIYWLNDQKKAVTGKRKIQRKRSR